VPVSARGEGKRKAQTQLTDQPPTHTRRRGGGGLEFAFAFAPWDVLHARRQFLSAPAYSSNGFIGNFLCVKVIT
jgi:hypothetical protein